MPALRHAFIDGKSQRNIIASLLIPACLFERIGHLGKIPELVAHCQNIAF